MEKGKAWRFGDDVDTDVIIPARRLTSSDPEVLKEYCMEDADPQFAKSVSKGDFIVAGSNFGCGSSREHAPISIKAAGVSGVIAKSFARIFFRNSFNIGLPILESAEASEGIEAGDEIEVDFASGTIKDLTKGAEYSAQPLPEFMRELVAAGGLINHVKKLIASGATFDSSSPGEAKPEVEEEEEQNEPGARMIALEKESRDPSVAAPWGDDEDDASPPSAEEELEAGEEDEDDEEEED